MCENAYRPVGVNTLTEKELGHSIKEPKVRVRWPTLSHQQLTTASVNLHQYFKERYVRSSAQMMTSTCMRRYISS